MKKILVVNVNWLGDVIFSSPVVKALKEQGHTVHITCLGVPRVQEILESIPNIDEVIIYDEKGRDRGPWAKWKLIRQLTREKFDVCYLLHRSWTRALLIFLAGIPIRVGYDEKRLGKLLTQAVQPSDKGMHRSDRYLRVIEADGVTVDDRDYQLNVDPKASEEINEMLKVQGINKDDYCIVVNPGGNWDLKRWPVSSYTQLIQQLMNGPTKIILSGAPKDRELIESILATLRERPVVLAGKTNLKQLIALMKRADLVVSGDSGPLHLASAVGTSVVAIFGPTRPEVTGPRGLGRVEILQKDVGCNRQPCYHLACPNNVCMQSVTVSNVLQIIQKIRS